MNWANQPFFSFPAPKPYALPISLAPVFDCRQLQDFMKIEYKQLKTMTSS